MSAARKVYEFPTYEAYKDYIENEQNKRDSQKRTVKRVRFENAVKVKYFRQSVLIACTALMFVSASLVSSGFLYKAQYEVNTYKKDIDNINIQIADYKVQLEGASTLKNIESIAIQNLGMQYPKKNQVVRINSNWNYALNSEN